MRLRYPRVLRRRETVHHPVRRLRQRGELAVAGQRQAHIAAPGRDTVETIAHRVERGEWRSRQLDDGDVADGRAE
jgi:hypothetical protein